MNNKTTHKTKPMILAMQEAEQALVGTVNGILKSGVPCYFLELIVDKIHRQIKDGARQELAHAAAQFTSESQPDSTNPENQDRVERT